MWLFSFFDLVLTIIKYDYKYYCSAVYGVRQDYDVTSLYARILYSFHLTDNISNDFHCVFYITHVVSIRKRIYIYMCILIYTCTYITDSATSFNPFTDLRVSVVMFRYLYLYIVVLYVHNLTVFTFCHPTALRNVITMLLCIILIRTILS